VVLGTVAVSDPDLVREACLEFGKERIVVGIDARDGMVAVRGWKDVTQRHFLDVALEIRELGVERLVFTDTSRDGMLSGPNFQAIRELGRRTGMRLIASGGISSIDDLIELKKLEPDGVEGAILGKALYEGKIQLEEAVSVASCKL
ncbi:MAG: HisA/HisF-related TIM barrel protein, partial [Thermacetogeniaceae bacterium]